MNSRIHVLKCTKIIDIVYLQRTKWNESVQHYFKKLTEDKKKTLASL